MRKATENQGNNRRLAEYNENTISKKNKVKDSGGQQCSLHFTPVHQETPMKPSQLDNRLSPPLPRKILAHSGPELSYKERPGTHRHSTPGPVASKGFIPSSHVGSSVKRPHSKPKDVLSSPKPPELTSNGPNHISNSSNKPYAISMDRVGLPQSTVQTVPAFLSVSPRNGDSSSIPQPLHPCLPHPAPLQLEKKSSSNISVDPVTESKSNMGTRRDSAQGKDSDQSRQSGDMASSRRGTPVVEFHGSSQKNRLDSATCPETSKRRCLQRPHSGGAQAAKPSADPLDPQGTSSRLGQALQASGLPAWPDGSDPFAATKQLPPARGAKQAVLDSTQSGVLRIRLSSGIKPSEEGLKNRKGADRPHSSLSPPRPRKDSRCSASPPPNTNWTSAGKPANPSPQTAERKRSDGSSSKPTSKLTSSNGPAVERCQTPRVRRAAVLPDDTEELFAPDPLTYVFGLPRDTPKSTAEGAPDESSKKDGSCGAASSSSGPAAASSCHKTQSPAPSAAASKRVKLENIPPPSSQLNPGVQLKRKSAAGESKALLPLSNNVSRRVLDSAASERTPASSSQRSQLQRSRVPVQEEDTVALDLDLDLDLDLSLDFDVTHTSQSSEEEEELISLRELIQHAAKPPDTPEKGGFSEPRTSGRHSSKTKSEPLPSTTKSGFCKNSLDVILKDMNLNKKAKELEMGYLTACKEELLRIAEYEEAEESREEGISTEERDFLQRYSLMQDAIWEVPPGEAVFNMEKIGRIFDQEMLQLRQCNASPQGVAQKTLLWSSRAQLRLHVTIGLFQEAYDGRSPCPTPVTWFLFKMMSVHRERLASDGILQALCGIAHSAACERANSGNQRFRVWVPSLADVALVLLNMGASLAALFPPGSLQPWFGEADLLEDGNVQSEKALDREQRPFAEHNCDNVLKYLSRSLSLCPRAYSDDELLLLLTLVSRISLDPQLLLLPSMTFHHLHHRIVGNFLDWDGMLPRICVALTGVTDHHHNMCHVLHLLPSNTRGRQLRHHLSLCMISKLVEGTCSYRPTQSTFQLSALRPFLLRMQPSSLRRDLLASGSRPRPEETCLDQQAYYLCYSLLTLASEASNLQAVTARQKEQLLCLSAALEAHVKSDIRETEKRLYRSKVKDLVARVYTNWQMLLQRTRPLHNKLYDYWQPVDTLMSGTEEQEDGEATVMDVEETPPAEQEEEEMEEEEELLGMEGKSTRNPTEWTEPVPGKLNLEAS